MKFTLAKTKQPSICHVRVHRTDQPAKGEKKLGKKSVHSIQSMLRGVSSHLHFGTFLNIVVDFPTYQSLRIAYPSTWSLNVVSNDINFASTPTLRRFPYTWKSGRGGISLSSQLPRNLNFVRYFHHVRSTTFC